MVIGIEETLEAEFDIEATGVAGRRCRNRRIAAAVSGPANEVERRIVGNATLSQGGVEPTDEIGDGSASREVVPLDQHRLFANRGQNRHADESPFRFAAYIDEDGSGRLA